MYREIKGDLIQLAKQGAFDVITHGCNCFCTMGAGIAPQMAKAFGCGSNRGIFKLEDHMTAGDINKLGQIEAKRINNEPNKTINVVNSYTQYNYGRNHADGDESPVDYDAITLCMRKINRLFKGKTIGLPKIGAGLAGGDWVVIKAIIQKELKDMDVTVVIYDK